MLWHGRCSEVAHTPPYIPSHIPSHVHTPDTYLTHTSHVTSHTSLQHLLSAPPHCTSFLAPPLCISSVHLLCAPPHCIASLHRLAPSYLLSAPPHCPPSLHPLPAPPRCYTSPHKSCRGGKRSRNGRGWKSITAEAVRTGGGCEEEEGAVSGDAGEAAGGGGGSER